MTEMFQKKQLGVLEVIAVRKGKTLVIRAWASEECFPGGPLEDFSKIFLGGQKWWNLFFPLKAYLHPRNILESFLMKLWWNALPSKLICMQCKENYRYRSCSHGKSWKFFCCFIKNVHVSCASSATVLVKELGHPICEYFDDQGPFWTHNKILILQWWQQNGCTRWRNFWQGVQIKTSYHTLTIKISWHSHIPMERGIFCLKQFEQTVHLAAEFLSDTESVSLAAQPFPSCCKMFWLKAVTFLISFEGAQPARSVKALGQKKYSWCTMPTCSLQPTAQQVHGNSWTLGCGKGLIVLYRNKLRSKKYYHRIFFHFADTVVGNTWLLCFNDCNDVGLQESKQLCLLEFKYFISPALAKEGQVMYTKKESGYQFRLKTFSL